MQSPQPSERPGALPHEYQIVDDQIFHDLWLTAGHEAFALIMASVSDEILPGDVTFDQADETLAIYGPHGAMAAIARRYPLLRYGVQTVDGSVMLLLMASRLSLTLPRLIKYLGAGIDEDEMAAITAGHLTEPADDRLMALAALRGALAE